MWGCCTSCVLSPVCRDAEHVFQRRNYRAHVQPAMLRKRWRTAPLSCAGTRGSTQTRGSTEGSFLCAHTPAGNRTAVKKTAWTAVTGAWPAKRAEQQLAYLWAVPFLLLLCVFPCLFFPDAHGFSHPFPLSPLSHPCFFHALLPVLLSPYSNFPMLPG